MSNEPLGRVAVIGAGPLGLESALYGRFLGYEVDLFEKANLLESLLPLRHLPMRALWSDATSPLGLAALAAQGHSTEAPAATESPTVDQWCRRYLEPLASTDLLAGRIKTHHEVKAAKWQGRSESDILNEPAFRLDFQDPGQQENHGLYHVVIETLGVSCQGNLREEGDSSRLAMDAILLEPSESSRWSEMPRERCDLWSPVPGYFALGRPANASAIGEIFQHGLSQIRRLYAQLAGREQLNLYESVRGLL